MRFRGEHELFWKGGDVVWVFGLGETGGTEPFAGGDFGEGWGEAVFVVGLVALGTAVSARHSERILFTGGTHLLAFQRRIVLLVDMTDETSFLRERLFRPPIEIAELVVGMY